MHLFANSLQPWNWQIIPSHSQQFRILPTPCFFGGSRLQKGIGATVVWIMPGSSFIARDTCLDLLHDILAGGARQDFHLRRSVDPTGRPWAFHGTSSAQECQQSHTWSHAEPTNVWSVCQESFSQMLRNPMSKDRKYNVHIMFILSMSLCF